MDQDLENLWLRRDRLTAEQVEDLLKETQRARDAAPSSDLNAALKGRICELEADLRVGRAERQGMQTEMDRLRRQVSDAAALIDNLVKVIEA